VVQSAGGTITSSGLVNGVKTVNAGDIDTFTITPATNYHIVSVTDNGSSVGASGTYIINGVLANHTITATFTINTFTLTVVQNAGGTITSSGLVNGVKTVNAGAIDTFTITPNANYHIVSVSDNGSSVGASGTYIINGVLANHTISATFAINTFTLTVVQSAGGTITSSGLVNGVKTVNAGDIDTFTITPDPDYHIVSVTDNGSSVGASGTYIINGVLANHTISASFAINTYTVTYDGNGSDGGSVPTDANTYATNATVTVLTNIGGFTKTGSTFIGWNTVAGGGGIGYLPGDPFTMGSTNVTLYAQWTP
jgi:uncharacterized repeat protein (TIGR02543 family)